MNRKKMMLLIMVGMLLLLSACGKSGGEDNISKYTYVPTFHELEMDGDYIENVAFADNKLYIISSKYDEQTGENNFSLTVSGIEDDSKEVVDLTFEKNEYIYNIVMDNNHFVLITSKYDEENMKSTYALKKIDFQGKTVYEKDLSEFLSKYSDAYIQRFAIDKEGNMFLAVGDQGIIVLSSEAKQIADIECKEWINAINATADGDVYISLYGNTGMELRKVDIANNKLGEPITMTFSMYGNITMSSGGGGETLLSNGSSLYEVSMDPFSEEKVLDWLNSDINGDYIKSFGMQSNGDLWAVTENYGSDTNRIEFITFEKKLTKDVPEKEIITLGTMWTSQSLKESIISFNKSNPTYRVQIKEYGVDDYEAGLIQMSADIGSGNCPDLINLENFNVNQFAASGAIEDLYAYMDNDDTINREDYVESVFRANEVNGKLYTIMPDFMITSLVGRTSDVGTNEGWTLREMIQVINEHPDVQVMEYASAESMLSTMMMTNMDTFIDWETGECNFNGEEFVELLEFAGQFETAESMNGAEIVYMGGTISDYRDGSILLRTQYIYSVEDYLVTKQLYGESINYIGYPVAEGSGILLTAGNGTYGMGTKSKHKEGAWEFLSFMLSAKEQKKNAESNSMYAFPVHKEALDIIFEKALVPNTYIDENGKEVEATKSSWGFEDGSIDVYAAKEEDIEELKKMMDSVTGTYQYNYSMYNIVIEEAAAYFAGQKSAQEVADIVQSRMKVYVNENR